MKEIVRFYLVVTEKLEKNSHRKRRKVVVVIDLN